MLFPRNRDRDNTCIFITVLYCMRFCDKQINREMVDIPRLSDTPIAESVK